MELFVLGLSHRTAPVEVRERFAVPEEGVPELAGRVRAIDGCEESFVVSTCNRVEIYAAARTAAALGEPLAALMAEMGRSSPASLAPHLYRHGGPAAVRHLFRVASSLDSMVVGEPQILGQLKAAFEACRGAGATGSSLQRAMDRAFAVAKRVRNETGIARQPVSMSSVAVDLAKQIFGDLGRHTVLLVGAGKMGELAAKHLCGAGVRSLLVANRNLDRARDLAARLGGEPRPLAELPDLLLQADIVITSTGAPGYLIDRQGLRPIMKARKHRAIFVIDIAVPRNVDPSIHQLENVFVYDVDDLQHIAGENLSDRQREAEAAEALVDAEATRFAREIQAQVATPVIVALREKAEAVRAEELARAMTRLEGLDPRQVKTVEMLAERLVNKLLHDVMTEVKRSATEPDGDQVLALARRLFRLEEREN
jgi:glutamyl-tRNA reductase